MGRCSQQGDAKAKAAKAAHPGKGRAEKKAKQGEKKEERTCLYALLGVEPTASQSEITKAYRSLALLLHPDKVAHRLEQQAASEETKDKKSFEQLKEEATKHFQELQAAYEVLKDPKKRKIYDETGSTGEETESFEEAYSYYRRVFPEFDFADIDSYREQYLESEEEIQDILDFCDRFDGDLTHFFEYIPFSDKDSLPRYIRILDDLVQTKRVKRSKKFKDTFELLEAQAEKLAALVEKESKQLLKKNAKKKKDDDFESLVLAIESNRKKRAKGAEAFFAQLEAKYGDMDSDEELMLPRAKGKKKEQSGSKRRRKN
ncbi:DnaJ domain-containing protein [Besnoitia besnoiti]|uniref:DnaJ domain-containing protein n=1 Tax=Besnoitia besnoiti TaxID=94643 RepID=A0A2A9MDJ0_BESBE|nr:DnaJ domain-containing protein [Besnoitia besnoiti]PFH33677.1 DnaJ domain-containing protein [Besnoitia besnoiti]